MLDRGSRLVAAGIIGCTVALIPVVSGAQAGNAWSPLAAPAAPVDVCRQLQSLSQTGLVASDTNGRIGTLAAGESVTMTATLGTASGGTFRIVGDPGGVNTLAGPSSIPGTLTFVSTGALPGSSIGVGYFIDTATGGTVNINVRSSCTAVQVPTTSSGALVLLVTLLSLSAAVALALRRA
jgi:hypothetical protein